MSGVSLLGGISAYTRYSSVPSLVASFGIGTAMAVSSLRIKDGMNYGLEGATGEFGTHAVPLRLRGGR
jgi:uncharacterized membrane protein (UPF0136 family)